MSVLGRTTKLIIENLTFVGNQIVDHGNLFINLQTNTLTKCVTVENLNAIK